MGDVVAGESTTAGDEVALKLLFNPCPEFWLKIIVESLTKLTIQPLPAPPVHNKLVDPTTKNLLEADAGVTVTVIMSVALAVALE